MSTRKRHIKSRAGCAGCKKRHLKCDESIPVCINCQVRNLDCQYGSRIPSNTAQEHLQPPVPQSSTHGDKDHRLELELLLRWTTSTFETVAVSDRDLDFWREVVPQASLDHDYLRYSIFAISALHQSKLTTLTYKISAYRVAALEYQDLAIKAFKSCGESISDGSEQCLFAFSIINLAVAVAQLGDSQKHIEEQSFSSGLVTMFKLVEGVSSIFTNNRTWLLSGPFASLAERPRDKIDDTKYSRLKEILQMLWQIRDAEYVVMARSDQDTVRTVQIFDDSSKVLKVLETSFEEYLSVGRSRMSATFRLTALLPDSFASGIADMHSFPLLTMMCWAIMLDGLGEERWWAKSAGKILIVQIAKVLLTKRQEWIQIMTLIHQEVGLPIFWSNCELASV